MNNITKTFLFLLFGLLPLHALLITTLKCKLWLDTDIVRFWKEILLILLFITASIQTLFKYNWNFSRLYKNNYLLGTVTSFSLLSFFFIFFPYLQPKLSWFLWFKYDVFFLIAFVIGLYISIDRKKILDSLLKTIFGVTAGVLILFLPWYLFGDISAVSGIFWFSSDVSTYSVNQCISFSQNVNGQHRFQGSFSGPIRWSVFLVVYYFIYIWYILNTYKKSIYGNKEKAFLVIPSLFIITSIFYSYSKTSILGLIFGISLFSYLVFTIVYKKKISKKYLAIAWSIAIVPIIWILYIKREVFLHLGSIINRFDNLLQSVEMFLYNPIWYGLWIAWPASWTWRSIESAGSWQIAVASTASTHKFLPENWYVQILLEQWILGLGLFIGVVSIIGLKLYAILKKKRDFFSIWIFTSYITLLFIANFTHAFEESATSYTLFLIIGVYIAQRNSIKTHSHKKK